MPRNPDLHFDWHLVEEGVQPEPDAHAEIQVEVAPPAPDPFGNGLAAYARRMMVEQNLVIRDGQAVGRRRPRAAPPVDWFGNAKVAHAPPVPEYKQYVPPEKVDMTTRPFYMPYDTLDEVNLRLVHSIIRLHDKPVLIVDAKYNGGVLTPFTLYFRHNINGDIQAHAYGPESGFDLSPFRSRYIAANGYAYWTYRMPIRGCYKQGMCSKNTFWEPAGRGGKGARQGARQETFLKAMREGAPTHHVDKGINTLRDIGVGGYSHALSAFVALYFDKGQYSIEYKGTRLGILDPKLILDGERGIKLLIPDSPEVTSNIWAIRRLEEVGIQLA